MEIDEFRNYIDRLLKNANHELDYCIRGLNGDKECNDDNPDSIEDDWLNSIDYAERDIDELECAKRIFERFEKSLEVEE